MTPAPSVKGWCPGAHRPMMSGDGLILRIRPIKARVTADQALGLCDTAIAYGNGVIDLTNRANLQIRGVRDADLTEVLSAIERLDLLDTDADLEARRNVMVTPFWTPGDMSEQIADRIYTALNDLPPLPAKFGFAVDCGGTRSLAHASADIRIEMDPQNRLVVRADGLDLAALATEETVISETVDMARWFAAVAGDIRRMRRLPKNIDHPGHWHRIEPRPDARDPEPGPCDLGYLLGAPFGQLDARDLMAVFRDTRASALRVTPWRLFLLEGVAAPQGDRFIKTPGDALLSVDACPGAPYCDQAHVETRDMARRLAALTAANLHVSGCAKGCARSAPAPVTLVGRNGRFDLVRDGCAWDEPAQFGLSPDQLADVIT